MLAILSPAKTLDFTPPPRRLAHTIPTLLSDSEQLIDVLRTKSASQLEKLMKISDKLAVLNRTRYSDWSAPFTPENAKQCLLAFRGDVYQGLEADTFKKADFDYAQKHLRILSGLYGILRPLDLIQAYRLEMGTSLKTRRGQNLYDFWAEQITDELNAALTAQRGQHLVNLASNEYFKAVKAKGLDAEVFTPVFKDQKNGQYKLISFFAKKARGMMADYIIRNRLKHPDELREFDSAGYAFNPDLSDDFTLTFTRDAPPAA
jgi:cytoplasmic iron level regulating protein YaaA (DUF328/UPF0246 family)